MDYDHLPVSQLLRGPLLNTPQGKVVIASVPLYCAAALLGLAFGVSPLLIKSPSAFFTLCLVWPFITFLYFVRTSGPSFAPSRARTIEVLIAALVPLALALWRLYA